MSDVSLSVPAPTRRPLLAVVRPLVLAGWAIAVVRLLLDAFAPGASMYFGLYYLLPPVMFVLGLRGAFDDVGWGRLMLAMVLTAFLVWTPMHAIAYTLAQFEGWTHGRFGADGSPEVAATTSAKIFTGLSVALGTAVAGSVWMTVGATLLVWLPQKLRGRGRPGAAGAGSAPGAGSQA